MDARIVRDTEASADHMLTQLVAHHYGMNPRDLQVSAQLRGNPIVTDGTHVVECSVSRSRPYTAVAILTPGETGWIGIDIESADALTVPAHTFAHILGPHERPSFTDLPEDDLGRALLRAWVRKEAVLKSMHTGFGALEPAQIECGPPTRADCTSHPWITVTDMVTEEYVAALAVNPAGSNGSDYHA